MTRTTVVAWLVAGSLILAAAQYCLPRIDAWSRVAAPDYSRTVPAADRFTFDCPPLGAEAVFARSLAGVVAASFALSFLMAWTGWRPSSRAARAGLTCALVVAALAALEVPLARFARSHPQLCVPDAALMWRLTPNRHDGAVETNEFGQRGRGIARVKPAGTFRVMVLGDSALYGYGVGDAETFSERLQAILSQGGKSVEVINAAVAGYTTYQGRRYLEEEGLSFQPDWLVVGFNNDAEVDLMSDRARVERPAAATWIMRQLYRSQVYLLMRKWLVNAHLDREVGQLERMTVLPPRDQRLRVPLEDFKQNLLAVERLARERGIGLTVVVMPRNPSLSARFPIDYRTIMHELSDPPRTVVADCYEGWRSPDHVDLFIEGDFVHPNAKGQKVLAELIAPTIRLEPRSAARSGETAP